MNGCSGRCAAVEGMAAAFDVTDGCIVTRAALIHPLRCCPTAICPQGQSRAEGTPVARGGGPPGTPPSVTSGPSAAPSGSGELPPIRTDSSKGLDPDSFITGAQLLLAV